MRLVVGKEEHGIAGSARMSFLARQLLRNLRVCNASQNMK